MTQIPAMAWALGHMTEILIVLSLLVNLAVGWLYFRRLSARHRLSLQVLQKMFQNYKVMSDGIGQLDQRVGQGIVAQGKIHDQQRVMLASLLRQVNHIDTMLTSSPAGAGSQVDTSSAASGQQLNSASARVRDSSGQPNVLRLADVLQGRVSSPRISGADLESELTRALSEPVRTDSQKISQIPLAEAAHG